MATSTGKTRTALGMILKATRFRRIFFIVDRNSLGEQTKDVFATICMIRRTLYEDSIPGVTNSFTRATVSAVTAEQATAFVTTNAKSESISV